MSSPPPPPPEQPPAPECPICLEAYTPTTTIPRVLPCGHTTCQSCLSQLLLFSNSPPLIHCPSCTHLLKLPHPLSSLPKNLDLLHFSPSPNKSPLHLKVTPYPLSLLTNGPLKDRLTNSQQTQLTFLLNLSFRNPKVRPIYGPFTPRDRLTSLNELTSNLTAWSSTVALELCEIFVTFRSEGLVCGCSGLSCFRLDEFGHVFVDLNQVLALGRRVRESEEDLSTTDVFVSPEVVLELMRRGSGVVGYGSDVWSLACVLLRVVCGERFGPGMYDYVSAVLKSDGVDECESLYAHWVDTVKGIVSETLVCGGGGGGLSSLQEMLLKCLEFDPGRRPSVIGVWESLRVVNNSCRIEIAGKFDEGSMKMNVEQCLVLGELCSVMSVLGKESGGCNGNEERSEVDGGRIGGASVSVTVENVVRELSVGKVSCKDLQGHVDCVTGLAVGGGFLFSSSFDKTVKVWSLQDFTHVHTFRGHEQKVMDVVFVDQEKPLCLSADSGGGICSWEIKLPFGQEPLMKWYEEKDWRYSGIHALAVSESGYLYTGSGDRLIKAWSLSDYTLLCSMGGHKSVVSALTICNGVLYSGSWDGTVRLWCLHDHSPLAVLGENMPGKVSSVVSLHADQNTTIAAHENGYIKIWMNDVLKASKQVHGGAIFALAKEEKWVFTGGWDKTVKVQELKGDPPEMDVVEVASVACDSVITALLFVQGFLFVGYANKLIKVYHCGP